MSQFHMRVASLTHHFDNGVKHCILEKIRGGVTWQESDCWRRLHQQHWSDPHLRQSAALPLPVPPPVHSHCQKPPHLTIGCKGSVVIHQLVDMDAYVCCHGIACSPCGIHCLCMRNFHDKMQLVSMIASACLHVISTQHKIQDEMVQKVNPQHRPHTAVNRY